MDFLPRSVNETNSYFLPAVLCNDIGLECSKTCISNPVKVKEEPDQLEGEKRCMASCLRFKLG